MTDLISRYLQHMLYPSLKSIIPVATSNEEGSCDRQLATDDWVIMSRVRCMCRLLVDCSSFTTSSANSSPTSDSTVTTGNNNTKSKSLKKGTSGSLSVSKSSSDALMQCWKSLVKKQLQETLASLLMDDRPHGVATGLVNIYTKLKCAMRELFGGHSRYAIALKEGFAEQLQTLTESHSVQVRHVYCLHNLHIVFM